MSAPTPPGARPPAGEAGPLRVAWSVPVVADRPGAGRGDLVRAAALAHALREAGHAVEMVEAAGKRGDGRGLYRGLLRPVLPDRAARILRDLGRRWRARSHAREVARRARETEAQVIVETQVHGLPSASRAARRCGLPVVLDDASPPREERALGPGLPGLVERAFRREAAAARALVVSSRSLRDQLVAHGVPADRIAVIGNGVDLSAHRGTDRAAARRRLGVDDRLVVGFVGSFQPWHRAELLVEAAAALGRQPPVHLLLVGDGPGRAGALDAARRHGLADRVTAPGRVPPGRVPELLAACDVGALPDTNEYGQPMKLLDYAAAGLPSVAPDRPPVREVVEDGRTALLFRPGDVEALAEAIDRLAADPSLRRAMGRRARREVARPASWARRAGELADLLRRVRDHGGGRDGGAR